MAVFRDNGDLPAGSRVLSMRAIVLAGASLILVAAGAAIALLWLLGGGSPSDTARLDAIRTAASIVVVTGGAAALLLAARRQRSTELDLVQKDHDATERRVTELYGRAVDQLGSDIEDLDLPNKHARGGQQAIMSPWQCGITSTCPRQRWTCCSRRSTGPRRR